MADEEYIEDAEGRLFDKDGVEHIPADVRRNPWFRVGLVAGLAWCLLSTAALIGAGVQGHWTAFFLVLSENVLSWFAELCLWAGIMPSGHGGGTGRAGPSRPPPRGVRRPP
jgi:hypothetical protein